MRRHSPQPEVHSHVRGSPRRRVATRSCVWLGIASVAISCGALSNFSVLESIHSRVAGPASQFLTVRDSIESSDPAVHFVRRPGAAIIKKPETIPTAAFTTATRSMAGHQPSLDPLIIPNPSESKTGSLFFPDTMVAFSRTLSEREVVPPATAALTEFIDEATFPTTHACTSTVQGMSWVTDSDGFTCSRSDVGVAGAHFGCCPRRRRSPLGAADEHLSRTLSMSSFSSLLSSQHSLPSSPTSVGWGLPRVGSSERYSCSSCDASTSCCAVYELCVSCCMAPERRPALETFRARSIHTTIRATDDAFEVCKYICRTSSGSVVHENSYRNSQKHCFGMNRPPLLPGISVNSDQSTSKEVASGQTSMVESLRQRLIPYIAPLSELQGLPKPKRPIKKEQAETATGPEHRPPALAAAHLTSAVAVKLFAPEGLMKSNSNGPKIFPCRVDDCGAVVPRKYP